MHNNRATGLPEYSRKTGCPETFEINFISSACLHMLCNNFKFINISPLWFLFLYFNNYIIKCMTTFPNSAASCVSASLLQVFPNSPASCVSASLLQVFLNSAASCVSASVLQVFPNSPASCVSASLLSAPCMS